MNQGISGTILAVDHNGEQTTLRLATGSNGSQREEHVAIPGRKQIPAGRSVKLVNFVRDRNGALVPGENARIALVRIAQPAQAPTAPQAKPARQPALPLPPLNARPAKGDGSSPANFQVALRPVEKAAPTPASAGGFIDFNDRSTRQAVFNRAIEVAREFADHIKKSGQVMSIDGRPYVKVAGWALLPAFENAKCYPVSVQVQPDGTALAEAVVEKEGVIVSRGFGACSPEEAIYSKKKGTITRKRPILNDRFAMAQTRARGAALKSRYAVLVTLAGYEPSIADEVEDAGGVEAPQPTEPDSRSEVKAAPANKEATPMTNAPAQKPKPEQIAFALKIFDNDKSALLREVANAGLLVFDITDVPVTLLKSIVERRVTERKNARAAAAATA